MIKPNDAGEGPVCIPVGLQNDKTKGRNFVMLNAAQQVAEAGGEAPPLTDDKSETSETQAREAGDTHRDRETQRGRGGGRGGKQGSLVGGRATAE